ncbi:MAG: isocitrate/isopropylmalate dehydrogenase family protein [Candidatus Nezhaarchaeota archaeon]|nr:isocitrate/isopropylmalate dehydrogenase family protein [Candidatus Nezhaarchaeota archaeon]
MAQYKVAVIPGDGVGPEVVEAALRVLRKLEEAYGRVGFGFTFIEAGMARYEKSGIQISDEDVELIKSCHALLKGPTATPLGPGSYRSVAVTLRQALDLYANVRPFKSMAGALHQGVDLVIVRENTEDLYVGIEYRVGGGAIGLRLITEGRSKRIAHFAFQLARRLKRRKVTVVHKANILKETCGLFRQACFEVAKEYPDIECDELLVDAAAYTIARRPQSLDVIVTTNLFGDILSDAAAGVTGGLGVAASANIGDRYAMFEPVHGTASKYAGTGVANPCGMILASKMMLDWLGEGEAASVLEEAVERVLKNSLRVTPDLGGSSSTMDMAEAVAEELGEVLKRRGLPRH